MTDEKGNFEFQKRIAKSQVVSTLGGIIGSALIAFSWIMISLSITISATTISTPAKEIERIYGIPEPVFTNGMISFGLGVTALILTALKARNMINKADKNLNLSR